MDVLRITTLQTDICWENKQENLRLLHEQLKKLRGETEIVVLPEMFSTGFTMNSEALAEPVTGETITTLRQWAVDYNLVLTGSYIASGLNPISFKKSYYNRAFFLTPEGEAHYYDKHHLFRMGGEIEHFTSGIQRPIISYRGWNILLLICYDLRFPVWSRNVNNEYDLVIYVASWPIPRRRVWEVLLEARAIENMSYVCGVNRVGTDGNNFSYNGGSFIFSPKGEKLTNVPDNEEGYATFSIDLTSLKRFREKFPAWKDADSFSLH